MNCLKLGHFFLRDCKSSHHCRHCQKTHHTLLHVDAQSPHTNSPPTVSSNTSAGSLTDTLLMTCQVHVGSKVKARALLDPASSSSFISERLVQGLGIPRSRSEIMISGVAGLRSSSPFRSVATVTISPTYSLRWLSFSTFVVPRVTSDLPLNPVELKTSWTHLNDLQCADPHFDTPSRIDMLLGVDVYIDSLLHGWRSGLPDSPVAFQTIFGWVLAGRTQSSPSHVVASHHISVASLNDDLLCKFWEIKEVSSMRELLSMEGQGVVNHRNRIARILMGDLKYPFLDERARKHWVNLGHRH